MALVIADRVRETSVTSGTADIALGGAVTGFQSFAVIGNNNTTYYCIAGQGTNEWEVGIGTYISGTNTLERTTVLSNSAGTAPSKINFLSGTKDVFVTYPASKSVDTDTSQTLTNKTLSTGTAITAGTINGAAIGGSTPAAGAFTSLTSNSTTTLNGTTIPASKTLADTDSSQTLTNKTISADSNTLSGIAASSFVLSNASGNIDGAAAQKAIPAGVVVGTTDTQTLTNKTISADNNTLSGIAASSFVLSNASGNIDGAAAQKAIPAGVVVGTTDTQTLTNKTLSTGTAITAGTINGAAIGGSTPAAGAFTTLSASDASVISVNSASTALRITQTGAGNALVVEDSANPDATPFVVNASGNVGIGTSSPLSKLDVNGNAAFSNGTGFTAANSLIRRIYSPAGSANQFEVAAIDFLTGLFSDNGQIGFATNSGLGLAERMRIDSSGNVGIGTSSPSAKLEVTGFIKQNGASNRFIQYNNSSVMVTELGVGVLSGSGDSLGLNNATTTGVISFGTNNTERMCIDSSGSILFGTTSVGGVGHTFTTGGAPYHIINSNATPSGHVFMSFRRSSTEIGSITQNGTTATAYNTASDYRLKNIEGELTNSGAYIDALRPVHGSWKADGSRFIGLIAHEVQEVSQTQVVTGEKDGEQMQAMDYSNAELIANLIAEVQSLRKRVAQLEQGA